MSIEIRMCTDLKCPVTTRVKPKGERWRSLSPALPEGSYLLVTDGENAEQMKLMRNLAATARRKGETVVVWVEAAGGSNGAQGSRPKGSVSGSSS